MKKRFLLFLKLILIILLLFIVLSCPTPQTSDDDSSDDENTKYSFEFELLNSDDMTNAKYITKVYSGTTFHSTSSVTTATNLVNKTITISNLTTNRVPYTIFAWVDIDGNGEYSSTDLGNILTINSSSTLINGVGIGVSWPDLDDTVINTTQSGIDTKVMKCYWLISGSSDSVDKDTLTTSPSSIDQVVGDASGTFSGGSVSAVTSSSSLRVIPSISTTYDLYCWVDVDNDNTRSTGDYEVTDTDVDASSFSGVTVTLTLMP